MPDSAPPVLRNAITQRQWDGARRCADAQDRAVQACRDAAEDAAVWQRHFVNSK